MADMKSALKRVLSNVKSNTSNLTQEADHNSRLPENIDLGPSSFERWQRANEGLIAEKKLPTRIMDLKKIERLEGLINILQQDIRNEVDRYSSVYPELTHAELSKIALVHKANEQDELIREQEIRRANQEEARRKALEQAEIDNARRNEEELRRHEEEMKKRAEADRLLTENAKNLMDE